MRVLLVDRWSGGRDGPGVYIRELAKGLLAGGHEPHLAYDQERGPESVAGFETHPVPGLNSRASRPEALAKLLGLAQELQPELHVVECLDVPWFAEALSAVAPLVFSLHTHTLTCPNWTRVLWRTGELCARDLSPACVVQHYWGGCGAGGGVGTLLSNLRRCFDARRTMRHFTAFQAPSRYVGDTLIRAGVEPRRVFVVQYPAPLLEEGARHVDVDPEPDRLLFLGRLDREKGSQVLLEACARLRAPFRLRLVGAADVDQNDRVVAAMLRKPPLAGRCELLPPTARHIDLSAHYSAAAIVIVPSLWGDPSPLVRLEAMAHGRAVVAFDSGGVASAIQHEVTGLVVPRGDVAALTAAIEGLLRDPARARAMGRAGRHFVESRLKPRQHADQFLSAFANLRRELST
jgi:glycosyltransferase involved in cell wall biosynthesis